MSDSNVIRFPVSPSSSAPAFDDRSAAAALLARPAEHSHLVQFYEDEEFLYDTVGRFLAAGLEAGDRLVVIATSEHRAGFIRRLEACGAQTAIASQQLTLLDADDTLATFMVGGMPDPDLFRNWSGSLIARITGDGEPKRIRAYGEMVDVLWRKGNSKAAIRLEELWNEAGEVHEFSLLCAYVMGNFYREGDATQFFEVCRNHSHVLPTESFFRIDDPSARLREISLLQQRARSLETEILHRAQLESALRQALRDRSRVEDELRACVKREKEAREQAEATAAFREVFLGILGHDLRNPLNTILTTVKMMVMRGELPAESTKRLERVISSGTRMHRMIEQLLDMTRARLTGAIPVERTAEQDLGPLVAKMVEESSAANPNRAIEIVAPGPCRASVDPDRFEQVVSNLLANALAHGTAATPVTVTLTERGSSVVLSVHNFGPPIDPEFMPHLFNPFTRPEQPRARTDGLGLGLYISERIVAAHEGTIEVASSQETGTLFQVTIPRP